MDNVLKKLARQLMAFDEASLMSLWEKYAQEVQRFEPTKRWEESTVVLGFIQTLRWKNQLFNYNMAEQSRTGRPESRPEVGEPLTAELFTAPDRLELAPRGKHGRAGNKKPKVLPFKLPENGENE